MAKENKANVATLLERIHIVQEMLLSGFKRRDILLYVASMEDNWKVTDSQVDNYISAANKNLIKEYEKDTIKLKAKYSARYDFIYKKAIGAKDYSLAAATNEKAVKLNIPPESTKVEHSGTLPMQLVFTTSTGCEPLTDAKDS